ncbi:hypothetical protein CMV_009864 [Castanea mollissima]|uniref:Amidase domain-containing protein n=1 Tax=Castanea mollissima TaxID=60419 RepID=A0A8J4RDM8_9ROSI|nr:hypothetical protein CMV_009864 [Castanea mollissima]
MGHMAKDTYYGAFMEKFDVDGYVTGFGNPDWARTHPAATSTAPAVLAILRGGATCVGKTVLDEMAYSMNGENKHYGTPKNPCAPDPVPGGSSSGSAVAVGAKLVDFSLGWFARDPVILNRVGRVLLQLPEVDPIIPSQIIIAEDCFQLSTIPSDRATEPLVKSVNKLFGGDLVKHAVLGDYVKEKVPSRKQFMTKGNVDQEYNIPSLAALASVVELLLRYEVKNNHGKWTELRAALNALLGDFGVLIIPTVPGPPPKLQSDPILLEAFRVRASSLQSIAGVSGFCQVSIPLGLYDNLPVAISLLAKHGSDAFLLILVEILYDTLQEEVGIAEKKGY